MAGDTAGPWEGSHDGRAGPGRRAAGPPRRRLGPAPGHPRDRRHRRRRGHPPPGPPRPRAGHPDRGPGGVLLRGQRGTAYRRAGRRAPSRRPRRAGDRRRHARRLRPRLPARAGRARRRGTGDRRARTERRDHRARRLRAAVGPVLPRGLPTAPAGRAALPVRRAGHRTAHPGLLRGAAPGRRLAVRSRRRVRTRPPGRGVPGAYQDLRGDPPGQPGRAGRLGGRRGAARRDHARGGGSGAGRRRATGCCRPRRRGGTIRSIRYAQESRHRRRRRSARAAQTGGVRGCGALARNRIAMNNIGHVSGFGVPSDVFSRYMRMAGHDVLMISGTDEHGTPILVQAEREGVSPRELADRFNPRSRINGETPEFVETRHFFLDLPALADALGEWLKSRTDWRPNVLKFSLNLLDDLRPRAMTRDIDWGIPVPLPGWEDNPAKRLYVWFDAVIGYLSASIEWARRSGDPEAWRLWWGNPEGEAAARSFYFMGKDNITFHAQIWPAELLAYNGEGSRGGSPGPRGKLALPTEVVSSEYLMMAGRRFSTSRQVVIYVRDFLSRYDADALRYFISVAGPETQDTDFTWAEFLRRNNDELVAGWGNLVNRSISMAAKNFGAIPPAGELTETDRALLAATKGAFDTVGGLIERHRQKAAIGEAMRVVAEVNKYFSESAPWKLKDDPARMGTILHVALQAVSDLNTVLTPFLPHAAQKVHELLGGTGVHAPMPEIREVSDLDGGPDYPILAGDYSVGARWESVPLVAGTRLEPPTPVFRKLDPSIVDEELARLES